MLAAMVQLNTHAKLAISWAFVVTGGVYLFYLSKTSIEKKRYENMKIRQRMYKDPFVDVKEQ